MGNFCSKEPPKTSTPPEENEEPNSPLIQKETPPMNDASVSKIREGLDQGSSPKKQRIEDQSSFGNDERLRREREFQEAEARRKREEEQLRAKEERERAERERIEQENLKRERERLEKERLERERLERERFEKERLEQERLEKGRLEKERLEKERLERERVEKERLEKEKLEREKIEKERLERLEKERLEKERLEKERLENERIEKEKFENEQKQTELDQMEEDNTKQEELISFEDQTQNQPPSHQPEFQQDLEQTSIALAAFQSFPKEIFRLLFTFLPREDRVKVRLLSKFFRDIMDKTGCLVFILNDVTRHLRVPNMVIDDRSYESIGEDELRQYLSVNTWIRHVLFRGSSWSPSKAARVLQDNVSIVEDVAFRVSAHCATEEFQQLEIIRKRNIVFNPLRIAFEGYSDLTQACDTILLKHGRSIGPALLTYCVFLKNEDLVKYLLQKNIEPYFAADDLKDSPITLALRQKSLNIIKIMEECCQGPLVGWFGKDIERPQVETLLNGQPVGTFLTRYSVRATSYVISHVLPNKVIEHMNQICPEPEGKVKVINKVDGTLFYDSFSDYIYKMMLKEGMYCNFPLPSAQPFSAILP